MMFLEVQQEHTLLETQEVTPLQLVAHTEVTVILLVHLIKKNQIHKKGYYRCNNLFYFFYV